ncbi:hypothetical protein ANCDUO_06308 [Ancylostoma duodenale]|uniref:Uncharacterized protein n=1 Tax=Ancylostoma duodenale TaxID=51022 RepID=A0A0C2GWH4_9BILA|nr:hypothetical protein ANCDUO_06308 [Ancylostoma duodenale]
MSDAEKDACPRFTKNSDTFIGPSSVPSRIEEIRENRRLNRTDTSYEPKPGIFIVLTRRHMPSILLTL